MEKERSQEQPEEMDCINDEVVSEWVEHKNDLLARFCTTFATLIRSLLKKPEVRPSVWSAMTYISIGTHA